MKLIIFCRDYISGKISFGELKQSLGDIFGNNKLINGDRNTGLQISINPTNIGFMLKVHILMVKGLCFYY